MIRTSIVTLTMAGITWMRAARTCGAMWRALGPMVTMAASEDVCTSRHHGRAVTGAGAGPAGREVDVSVAGDVEAVRAAAQQLAFCRVKAVSADGAAQVRGDRRECLVRPGGERKVGKIA
jgi:hypothetical protein